MRLREYRPQLPLAHLPPYPPRYLLPPRYPYPATPHSIRYLDAPSYPTSVLVYLPSMRGVRYGFSRLGIHQCRHSLSIPLDTEVIVVYGEVSKGQLP